MGGMVLGLTGGMVPVLRRAGLLLLGSLLLSPHAKSKSGGAMQALFEYGFRCLSTGLLAGAGLGLLVTCLVYLFKYTRPSRRTLFWLLRLAILLGFGGFVTYQATVLDWDTVFPLVSEKLLELVGIHLPTEE